MKRLCGVTVRGRSAEHLGFVGWQGGYRKGFRQIRGAVAGERLQAFVNDVSGLEQGGLEGLRERLNY